MRRRKRWPSPAWSAPLFASCFVSIFAAATAFAAEPFLAPAEPSGSIVVRLYPTENVAPGTPRLVTFGVPFPRGSVTIAGLAKVRVLRGGSEIPAWVEQLTPWRHTTNPAVDGQSVRVARIQLQYSFSVSYPGFETVTVEWGLTNRGQSLSFANPRTGWHLVTTGSYLAADGVSEPDVYAVLPADHLAKGALKLTRMDPFDPGIGEGRDDPFAMDAVAHWPDYEEQQHAAKNNSFTLVNEDDPRVDPRNYCPYKTDYEPWLYDRASSLYVLYLRSGFLKPLREAVRAADFYNNHLNTSGRFDLNPSDPKYSYNECLAYTHWLTGDDNARPKISLVVNSLASFPSRWSPSVGFWTERHAGLKLLANVVAYEVLGDAYKAAVETIKGDYIWHQNGAGGQIPSPRVDGGLYHTGAQHSEGTRKAYVASSWMTVLLVDAMLRTYAVTEDPAVAAFIQRVGNFEKTATRSDSSHQYDNHAGPLWYADYLTRHNGTVDMRSHQFMEEHALEVGAATAWAGYFAALLGTPDPVLTQRASDLYFTYDIGVNFWIRPEAPASGLSAYRVGPWRKYGWEHRPSGGLSWAMANQQ
jgi:hypothetical protein